MRTKVFRRILHASDFSPASRPAFGKAVALAKANGAGLIVLHVMTETLPLSADGYIDPSTYAALRTSTERWSKKQLDARVARARAQGVRVQGVLIDHGAAHEQIVRAARSRGADLIVVGTHGRTGFRKLLLGSVAERVVATAPCPVLTVRGK